MSFKVKRSDAKPYLSELTFAIDGTYYNIYADNTTSNQYLNLPIKYVIENEIPYVSGKMCKYPHVFTGELREVQEEVLEPIVKSLNDTRAVLICLATGLGKTILAIKCACKLKLKTVIVVTKVAIIDQWVKSIKAVTSSSVYRIDGSTSVKNKFDTEAGFYVTTPHFLKKFKDLICENTSAIIVDEAHEFCTQAKVDSIMGINSEVIIGLTATPHENKRSVSTLNILYSETPIYKFNIYTHVTYNKIITDRVYRYIMYGESAWNIMVNAQCMDYVRNMYIASICNKYHDKSILILGKRVEQLKVISSFIKDKECYDIVDKYIDYTKRITLITFSKGGTGFDRPDTEILILASDVMSNFKQYIGRCLRRPDINPIVFDIVDNNSTLYKHLDERMEHVEQSKVKYSSITTDIVFTKKVIILAAGSSTRFGNVKQLTPIDTPGRPLLFYNMLNAANCGITSFSIIIRKEHKFLFDKFLDEFKDELSACWCNFTNNDHKEVIKCRTCDEKEDKQRIINNTTDATVTCCDHNFHENVKCVKSNSTTVSCVCDFRGCSCSRNISIELIIQDVDEETGKPRGTAEALTLVNTKQSIIMNADDYYTKEAIGAACLLQETGLVTYELNKTLSKFGAVIRGVCEVVDDKLVSIKETSVTKGKKNTKVSMNLWVLTTDISTDVNKFLIGKEDREVNITEYMQTIPDIACVHTDSEWFGLTYADDLPHVETRISQIYG